MPINFKDTSSGEIIQDFYHDEEFTNYENSQDMKISVSAMIKDVTMLDAIASRFGTTRSSLVSKILHNNVQDMYFNLSPEDRESISLIADLETTEILKKKGVETLTVCSTSDEETKHQDHSWRGFNEACLTAEKGRKDAES